MQYSFFNVISYLHLFLAILIVAYITSLILNKGESRHHSRIPVVIFSVAALFFMVFSKLSDLNLSQDNAIQYAGFAQEESLTLQPELSGYLTYLGNIKGVLSPSKVQPSIAITNQHYDLFGEEFMFATKIAHECFDVSASPALEEITTLYPGRKDEFYNTLSALITNPKYQSTNPLCDIRITNLFL